MQWDCSVSQMEAGQERGHDSMGKVKVNSSVPASRAVLRCAAGGHLRHPRLQHWGLEQPGQRQRGHAKGSRVGGGLPLRVRGERGRGGRGCCKGLQGPRRVGVDAEKCVQHVAASARPLMHHA